jgi:hypothetical protein
MQDMQWYCCLDVFFKFLPYLSFKVFELEMLNLVLASVTKSG